ncbi:hypothetical protein F0A16_01750 [Salinicola corii]|uniref:Uncharacterized protein n=1 Tax=Salinicola corii TaxID=2606937 RepID=A0A640WIY8_9GAMM|nr:MULTISPECIES: hypothetical protein [Salinicola]KAA0020545.1 hypothetical protein F0A16_01750 [Salinicola corii]NRB56441.1 hypothetical protein [Salinicola sp.]
MISVLTFLLIFVGVAVSVYQVYDIYYAQNFEDDERQASSETPLGQLSQQAERYAATGEPQRLLDIAGRLFGAHFDQRLLLSAASLPNAPQYLGALLRRGRRIVINGRLRVRHPLAWKTNLPRRDSRPVLLTLVLVNCLVVMFLGGLSLYTIAYRVPVESLAWMNSDWILMLLIYAVIAMTHGISRLDGYLHDLYLIGTLSRTAG